MESFSSIEKEYYYSNYNLSYNDPKIFWNKYIKNNKKLLKWAITFINKKTKNKKGTFICEGILLNYKDVDKDIYYDFINLIYSNKEIARSSADDNISYLSLSLWNKDLKLNKKQKDFAVSEALKDENIHGKGPFDLKFYILNNPNWNLSEKKKLVYDFYTDDVWYDYLEEFEWNVINEAYNLNDKVNLNISNLYDYDYEFILNTYDKNICDKIEFCMNMHKIRPSHKKVLVK